MNLTVWSLTLTLVVQAWYGYQLKWLGVRQIVRELSRNFIVSGEWSPWMSCRVWLQLLLMYRFICIPSSHQTTWYAVAAAVLISCNIQTYSRLVFFLTMFSVFLFFFAACKWFLSRPSSSSVIFIWLKEASCWWHDVMWSIFFNFYSSRATFLT